MDISAIIQNREENERKLRATFPEEIWLLILDVTDNPNDLLTLSHTSQFWYNLLKPGRQEYHFPKVIHSLVENKFLPPSNWKDILRLRLVCKSWKFGTDHLLETRSDPTSIRAHRFYDFRHRMEECRVCYPFQFSIHAKRKKDKLEYEIIPMMAKNYNPFPSRVVKISENGWFYNPIDRCRRKEIFSLHRSNAENFLKVAGHHFWYANITIGAEMASVEWYNLLCKYVLLLPNIKSLYVTCLCRDPPLTSPITHFPSFPTIPGLELISVADAPYAATNAILAANRHVQILLIPRMLPFSNNGGLSPEDDGYMKSIEFWQLTNVHTASICFPTHQDFLALPRNWSLKTFLVGHALNMGGHWESIFKKLEVYKETLNDLYIELPKGITMDEKIAIKKAAERKLNLQYLKRLKIVIYNLCSLDFLFGLSSLEQLCISFRHDRDYISEDAVSGICSRFMESNIWELLPSLESVSFKRLSEMKVFRRPGAPSKN